MLIAPRLKGIKVTGGTMDADGQLAGTPSCTVDAIAVIFSDAAAGELSGEAAAVQFVMDAFGHLKAIGRSEGASALLEKAGVVEDDGVTDLGKEFIAAAAKRFFEREPSVRSVGLR